MNRPSQKIALWPAVALASLIISTTSPALGQGLPTDALSGGGPNPKAVMMYNLGITAYKQGSTDAAVIFFKRACDIDPNLADAQYNLAVIYQSQHRYKEAIPRFEEVLRIKPNDPDAHFQLGAILQESGRGAEARQYFSAIAPNSNHFPEAQRRLAQLNAGGGQAAPYNPGQQPPASDNAPALANPAYTTPINNQPPPVSIQPPVTETPGAIDTTNPPATNPVTTASQPGAPAAVPASAPNPVPIQPNLSLRIVATGFNAPAGLAFDKNDNLYVANYLTNTIDRIAPDGTKTQFSSGPNLRGPIGLIADDNCNVYVANYNGGTVAKINPAGVSTLIATGFKKPYYLTLDREGNLYVSQQEDNSIVRITLPRQPQAALKTP